MRGRLYSLAVSMALAFCLWLSLAGLDTSLLDLTVGLSPHSLPDHLHIKGEVPKEVILRVRVNAARVRFLADRKLTLPLDLSRTQEGYNVLPVLLGPLQLPRGVQVLDINPEMIEFEALVLSQKQVPVKPNLVGRPAPDFRLEELTLEPSDVTIQGPSEVLAQVERLETTVLSVDGLTQDAVFSVNLVPPEGLVTIIGSKEVRATVRISDEQRVAPDRKKEVKP